MQADHTAKKGAISFRGLITTIAHTLDLHMELATLDPLPMLFIDIDVCLHMRLIKNMRYSLLIANMEVPSIILPCPNCTNVRVRENWIYDLNVGAEARMEPMDIHENVVVDGATDDEYDQRKGVSPVHRSYICHTG